MNEAKYIKYCASDVEVGHTDEVEWKDDLSGEFVVD